MFCSAATIIITHTSYPYHNHHFFHPFCYQKNCQLMCILQKSRFGTYNTLGVKKWIGLFVCFHHSVCFFCCLVRFLAKSRSKNHINIWTTLIQKKKKYIYLYTPFSSGWLAVDGWLPPPFFYSRCVCVHINGWKSDDDKVYTCYTLYVLYININMTLKLKMVKEKKSSQMSAPLLFVQLCIFVFYDLMMWCECVYVCVCIRNIHVL